MFVFMIVLFVVGYAVIALEHPLKINKSATALLLAVLLWLCAVIGGSSILVDTTSLRDFVMSHPGEGFKDWLVHGQLVHALGDVSEILFFLLGAMTIVELIDSQGGFQIITDKIKTTKKVKLLWIIGLLAFALSSVLDNLTTSIVMVALLRKIIDSKKDRWFFASIVIIAANAGGAWTPIGDVTTIMLWIGGKVSALNIMQMTFVASIMSIIVPLAVLSFILKGNLERPQVADDDMAMQKPARWQSILFLCLGIGALVFVPIFKSLTGLPPYLGMLGGLSVLWMISETLYRNQPEEVQRRFSISNIIQRVDVPSILFFLGILMAVNALQTVGHLPLLATKLETIPLSEPSKYYVISMIIGVVSSIIDNVPLVAATMGMYSFPMDHYFWEFIAYCAGTGGSILIIGSAAGVAVMGMEKIDFIWYLKHITWIALLGYFAGCGTFILEKNIRAALGSHHTDSMKATELVMSEDGVANFLNDNTFAYVESNDEIKDSTLIQFIRYQENKVSYSGMHFQNFQTNLPKQDSLFTFNNSANLVLGDYQISIKDTLAEVIYGGTYLIVTKSGQVVLVSQNGYIPLKKL